MYNDCSANATVRDGRWLRLYKMYFKTKIGVDEVLLDKSDISFPVVKVPGEPQGSRLVLVRMPYVIKVIGVEENDWSIFVIRVRSSFSHQNLPNTLLPWNSRRTTWWHVRTPPAGRRGS